MTGEVGDASKVDPANTINVNYEDLPEEQQMKFEAGLKQQNEELKERMLACYGKLGKVWSRRRSSSCRRSHPPHHHRLFLNSSM
jgi:hypothetical protein